MFERLHHGWRLFKESWTYLKTNRKIFKIPFTAFWLWLLFMLPVLAIFAVGIFNFIYDWFAVEWAYALCVGGGILGVFLTYFVMNIYVGMIVAAVYATEIGHKERLLDNLKGNWGALARFALFLTAFAIMNYIVRSIASRFGGRIGGRIAGYAMAAVRAIIAFLTTFTVAVIVIEEVGMREGIKRSIQLVKKYWVQVLFGYFVGFVLGLLAMLILVGETGLWLALIVIGVLPINLYSIVGYGIVVVITLIIIELIYSLLMNVYYAKMYIEALKAERGDISSEALAKYAITTEGIGAPSRVGQLTTEQLKALDRVERWFVKKPSY